MSNITRGIDIKLNIKPVFVDFTHQYVYEGPCRFGKGDSLTPEFDQMTSNEIYKFFVAAVKENVPDCVHVMDPVRIKSYTDEWIISEDDMKEALAPDDTDAYIITGSGRCTQVTIEFARRCKKPIFFYNAVLFGISTETTALKARGIECYPLYDWEKGGRIMRAMQVKKALANTRALLVNRFSTDYSPVSAQDGFLCLEDVAEKLKFKYSMMDVHEFLDQLTVDRCCDNPTTPGRKQQNLTSEDMKEVEKITDELIANADACDMEKENMIPSVKAYYLVRKLLDYRYCNAFSAPCPDMCSTRRLNEERCTLCLTHSLLEEQGIPSACEIDLNILICKIILENLTNQATYMGNTCWFQLKDGKPVAPDFSAALPEELEPLQGNDNLMVTLHSVANRQLKGYGTPEESYEVRSFAFSGWGVTLRYDFSKDLGQDVTVIRIDPKCEKMLVFRGKIKGQLGFKRQNCSTAVVYEVTDARAAYEKTCEFGSHMALVYGDYVDDLREVCRLLDLEMVLCD